MTTGLEGLMNPGLCTVMIQIISQCTITHQQPSVFPAHLPLTRLQYMWTVMLALCPSTRSSQICCTTSTLSTPHSLKPFTLGLELGFLTPISTSVLTQKTEPLLLL